VTGFHNDSINQIVDLRGIGNVPATFIRKICQEVMPSEPIFSNPTRCRYMTDAIWRTLIGNRSLGNALPCHDTHRILFTRLCQQEEDGSTPSQYTQRDPAIRRFATAMLKAIAFGESFPHRRFFITVSGFVGLGTPNCEKGDAICILKGYSMPVILRPVDDHYQFLGSAYVHGIMGGEGQSEMVSGETYSKFTIQ